MKSERLTSQKKIILDYIKSVKTHPSAEVVFRDVRKKLPTISLGTVYRILKNLKERGEIQEILLSNETHFDGENMPHAHFVCQKCKRIFDLMDLCKNCSIIKKKKTKVGKINYYQIFFYGYCKKCKGK